MKRTSPVILLLMLSTISLLLVVLVSSAQGQTPLVNSLPTICNTGKKVNLNPASGTVVAAAMLPGVYTCDATQTLSPTFPWVWNVPAGAAGGVVTSVFGRTGAITAQNGDYTATNVGLGNVTNNAQTQAAIMPNTAPSAGQLPVGNAGGTAYAPVTMSGDCTLASTGAIACHAPVVTTATLPTCNSGAEGTIRAVTDADTDAWGDTVVHTSGALHVLAYCDGTLWTVAAK